MPARLVPVALVLLAAPAVYLRVGWWRMESACGLDDPSYPTHHFATYDWS